jgi:hypothetical protein
LHDKIREALESDRDVFLRRLLAGPSVPCYTHWVMIRLFRANRAVGGNLKYSAMDGQRIKKYVTSHPDALLTWLHASTQLLKALLDPNVAENVAAHAILSIAAGDVWRGWMDVFKNPTASRAILLPLQTPLLNSKDGSCASKAKTGKHEIEERKRQRHARVDHAKKIVLIFLEAFNLPWTLKEPDQLAWSNLNYAAAMVHVRLLEYGVPVNAEKNVYQ